MTRDALIVLLLYGAFTGVLNALVGERSRIDAWAESKPRLAAVLKFLRAIGLDPWLLVPVATLAIKKRLPLAQRTGSLSVAPFPPPPPAKDTAPNNTIPPLGPELPPLTLDREDKE